MAEVIFYYEENVTKIQCNSEDTMKDIIDKFLNKIDKKETDTSLFYLYNGTSINKELTFSEQTNEFDKKSQKMSILVNQSIEDDDKKNEILSEEIICPTCKDNIFIEIKNFKINLSGCRNNHNINDIPLNTFEETQKIDISKIICDICKINNKSNIYKNIFYFCCTCNKNICPLCNSNHDKGHLIINYDDMNYVCKKHNDTFIKYCKTCKENICIMCEDKCDSHDILELGKILINKGILLKTEDELKNILAQFASKIKVKEIFDKVNGNIKLLNKIINNIINSYDMKKRNYYKLQNMNNINNSCEQLIKELKKLINNDNIYEIYEYIFGVFYGANEEKYAGEKRNGLKEGKGIFIYNTNDIYQRKIYDGDWKNNVREGKGILYFTNGCKYEGDWKNDLKEGKGIIHYSDGNRYEGDWKNDKKEGKGIYYWKLGDRYEGDWKNDEKDGKGIYYWEIGDSYDGDWKKGKKEGKGILYYKNGDKYDGDWRNDIREGIGTMTWMKEDQFNLIDENNKVDVYEGGWMKDKREGNGIMRFCNGDLYEGTWGNDLKEGKGI